MSKKSADPSRTERAQEAMRQQASAERRRRLLLGGGIAAVLVAVVVVAFLLTRGSDTTGETPDAVPSGVTDDYGVVVGEEGAATELVLYEDPQCPACAQLEAAVGEQVTAAVADGSVAVEYRIVSFLDRASTNDYSSRAANALLAVQDTAGPEAFARMHDLLFADQPAEGGPGYTDDQLVELAVTAGAEESRVRPLVEDQAFAQWIANATDAMSRNGVNGTPGVLVDGELVQGDPVTAVLEALGRTG